MLPSTSGSPVCSLCPSRFLLLKIADTRSSLIPSRCRYAPGNIITRSVLSYHMFLQTRRSALSFSLSLSLLFRCLNEVSRPYTTRVSQLVSKKVQRVHLTSSSASSGFFLLPPLRQVTARSADGPCRRLPKPQRGRYEASVGWATVVSASTICTSEVGRGRPRGVPVQTWPIRHGPGRVGCRTAVPIQNGLRRCGVTKVRHIGWGRVVAPSRVVASADARPRTRCARASADAKFRDRPCSKITSRPAPRRSAPVSRRRATRARRGRSARPQADKDKRNAVRVELCVDDRVVPCQCCERARVARAARWHVVIVAGAYLQSYGASARTST